MAKIQFSKQANEFHITIQYELPDTTSIECWLPLKQAAGRLLNRTSDSSGRLYYQIGKSGYEGYSTHEYYYELAGGSWDKAVPSMDYHLSHLCHHWWCCNPSHLVYEPNWVNIMRQTCTISVDYMDGGLTACSCTRTTHPDFEIQPCIWPPLRWFQKHHISRRSCLDMKYMEQGRRQFEKVFKSDYDKLLEYIKEL